MTTPDIEKIAESVLQEINPIHEEELKELIGDEGKISKSELFSAYAIAVKSHSERFAIELVKRVFESSK